MIDELKVAVVQMPAKQVVFNPGAKDENVKHIVSYIWRRRSYAQDVVYRPR